MPNYNKVIFAGHLTRDINLKYTPNNTAIAEFGLAISRKFNDASGTQRTETCFIECQCFGKSAETLNKYVSKGDPIMLDGRLIFQQWTDKDGNKKSRHSVSVDSFQFLKSQTQENQEQPQLQEDPF
jgi:single-strand DNA-binding protein